MPNGYSRVQAKVKEREGEEGRRGEGKRDRAKKHI
jgi:hypothetical protein